MHFLITAGGTREYIDPVRFISNAGSGKMGYALAVAAVKAGHKITLITAPTNLKKPDKTSVIDVKTAKEMFLAVKKQFPKCDCLIMTAAVSDYTVANPSKTKIKKSSQLMTIKLKPTADILKWAGLHKKNQIVVGFALEDRHVKPNAEKKLREKNLDMIIANTPAAIGADASSVEFKTPGSDWLKLPLAPKAATAKKIINIIEKLNSRFVWSSLSIVR